MKEKDKHKQVLSDIFLVPVETVYTSREEVFPPD